MKTFRLIGTVVGVVIASLTYTQFTYASGDDEKTEIEPTVAYAFNLPYAPDQIENLSKVVPALGNSIVVDISERVKPFQLIAQPSHLSWIRNYHHARQHNLEILTLGNAICNYFGYAGMALTEEEEEKIFADRQNYTTFLFGNSVKWITQANDSRLNELFQVIFDASTGKQQLTHPSKSQVTLWAGRPFSNSQLDYNNDYYPTVFESLLCRSGQAVSKAYKKRIKRRVDALKRAATGEWDILTDSDLSE